MSNILTIEKTEFKTNSGSTYGLRIYDGYGKDYDNNFEKDEFDNLIDDQEIVNYAKKLFVDFFIDKDVYSAIDVNGELYLEDEFANLLLEDFNDE